MNLRKIFDAIDYKAASSKLSNNFFVQLAALTEPLLTKRKAYKDITSERQVDVLGNSVRVQRKGDQVQLFVNGRTAGKEKLGAKTIKSLILQAATSEIQGKIKVNRPKGRSIRTDRNELSPVKLKEKGIEFPKGVYNALKYDKEGNRQSVLTNDLKSQEVLTKGNYKLAVEQGLIKAKDYREFGNYYVKGSNPVIEVELNEHADPDLSPEWDINEFIARIDKTDQVQELINERKWFYLLFKGQLYKWEPGNETLVKVK